MPNITLHWAGSGRGKRGGIRAIYFWHAGPEAIYMLTAPKRIATIWRRQADSKAPVLRLVTAIERERQG